MNQFFELNRSIRIFNILLVLCAQIILAYKIGIHFEFELILLLLITSLSIAIGNLENNILDYQLDLKYKNKVPSPFLENQKLAKSILYFLKLLTFFISLFLTYYIGNLALLITVFIVLALLYGYNYYFKKWAFIGNFVIATLCLVSFMLIPMVLPFPNDDSKSFFIIINGLHIFLLTLTRELVKDVCDKEADVHFHYKTMPIIWQTGLISGLIILYFVLLLMLNFIIMAHIPKFSFIFLLLECTLGILLLKKDWKKMDLVLKIYILLGIISMSFFKI